MTSHGSATKRLLERESPKDAASVTQRTRTLTSSSRFSYQNDVRLIAWAGHSGLSKVASARSAQFNLSFSQLPLDQFNGQKSMNL